MLWRNLSILSNPVYRYFAEGIFREVSCEFLEVFTKDWLPGEIPEKKTQKSSQGILQRNHEEIYQESLEKCLKKSSKKFR